MKNLAVARKITGAAPQVENIATLIDPPGSTLGEPAWLSEIVLASGCDMLLDLHNVYANSLNFGLDPLEFIDALPLERVASIHLAGGKWIGPDEDRRLLDDHLHDVPDPVYALLEEVASRAGRPPHGHHRARRRLPFNRGLEPATRPREGLGGEGSFAAPGRNASGIAGMSLRFEAFLARIYVDAGARNRFLQNPREEAVAAGLSPAEVDAAVKIDRPGLHLTANSLVRKRKGKAARR